MGAQWFARIGRWDFSVTDAGEIVVTDLPQCGGSEKQPPFAMLPPDARAQFMRQAETLLRLKKQFYT